jgi:hypothetical protein
MYSANTRPAKSCGPFVVARRNKYPQLSPQDSVVRENVGAPSLVQLFRTNSGIFVRAVRTAFAHLVIVSEGNLMLFLSLLLQVR